MTPKNEPDSLARMTAVAESCLERLNELSRRELQAAQERIRDLNQDLETTRSALEDAEREARRLRRSPSYQVGRWLLAPFLVVGHVGKSFREHRKAKRRKRRESRGW